MKAKPMSPFLFFVGIGLLLGWCQAAASQDFGLYLDYARYKYNDQKYLLEFFYSFDPHRLSVKDSASGVEHEAVIDWRITRNDTLWVAKAWRVQSSSQELASSGDDAMIDLMRYIAIPGRYQVEMMIRDLANDSSQQTSLNLVLDPMPGQDLWMSDIKLAAAIRKEEPDSSQRAFYRNQFVVIPQASCQYSEQQPMLFYYLESYNLSENAAGESYKVKCYVSDLDGNAVNSVRGRTMLKPKTMDASVEVGSLHLGMLGAGNYLFNVETLAADDRLLAKKSKPFAMLGAPPQQPVQVPGAKLAMLGIFANMPPEQVEDEFKKAAYICTGEEKQMYAQLQTPEARKQFLAELWARRDPRPETPVNEYYHEYHRRIAAINESFRSLARQGWQTDRGRVYLIYGQPSDVDRYPSTDESRPYERWRYDTIEGGVEFIFIDFSGFKEYRLVNSTKVGEYRDPNWELKLAY